MQLFVCYFSGSYSKVMLSSCFLIVFSNQKCLFVNSFLLSCEETSNGRKNLVEFLVKMHVTIATASSITRTLHAAVERLRSEEELGAENRKMHLSLFHGGKKFGLVVFIR